MIRKVYVFCIIIIAFTVFTGCRGKGDQTPSDQGAQLQETQGDTSKFDPDNENDSVNYSELSQVLGPFTPRESDYRFGVIMKFFGNEYWQLLAQGMESKAGELGIYMDIQAAATESDPEGQLAAMERMVEAGYDAILISPQTDKNLMPAVIRAREKGILIVNVDDAVIDDAEYYVGPNQYENGIRAAQYFIETYPDGGKVAIIKGLADVYAVRQRSQGFIDTLMGTSFTIVAQEHGDWDLQQSLHIAEDIMTSHHDLLGFYCNNDIMALGVVEAAKGMGRLDRTTVIGTDGIMSAYESIRSGEMIGTIDSFPYETGLVAVEVAIRILNGEKVNRVVYSPQNLVTLENVDNSYPIP